MPTEMYEEFLHLLRTNPEFREEVRRLILSEELLSLPALVQENSRQIAHLAE